MEKTIAQHIEERLNEMTTDNYCWGRIYKSHSDSIGNFSFNHCEHKDGCYEYEKSIDNGRLIEEFVDLYSDFVIVGGARFYRNYGKRKGQWHGYTRQIDEERSEVVKINVTSEMKKALDKISTLPIK